MNDIETSVSKSARRLRAVELVARWTARLTGLFLLGLVLLIVVGEVVVGGGGPNLAKATWLERITFLAFLAIPTGLAAILWRELLGGLLVIGGLAAFYGLNFAQAGQFPAGLFPYFLLPGLLAIAAWALGRIRPKAAAA